MALGRAPRTHRAGSNERHMNPLWSPASAVELPPYIECDCSLPARHCTLVWVPLPTTGLRVSYTGSFAGIAPDHGPVVRDVSIGRRYLITAAPILEVSIALWYGRPSIQRPRITKVRRYVCLWSIVPPPLFEERRSPFFPSTRLIFALLVLSYPQSGSPMHRAWAQRE
jgi:hypothetical protein